MPNSTGEFVRNIILRRHLESLPSEDLRAGFMAELTEQAAADDPPFSLDYWRLNLRGCAALGNPPRKTTLR
jgi:hypothetical protein